MTTNLIHVFDVADKKQIVIRCSNSGEECVLSEDKTPSRAFANAKAELNRMINMLTELEQSENPVDLQEWAAIAKKYEDQAA